MFLSPVYRCNMLGSIEDTQFFTEWVETATAAVSDAKAILLKDDKYEGYTLIEGWKKQTGESKIGKFL